MKKKNFNKKLEFKKELITNLNDIKGGYNYADTDGCGSSGPIIVKSIVCPTAIFTRPC